MGIKIMSAFLGRDKGQVPAVIACANRNDVDVLCLQEVMDTELPDLDNVYRFVHFVPMTRFKDGTTMGLATCTNKVVTGERVHFYMGNATELMDFDERTPELVNATKRRPLLTCDVHSNNKMYRVGNTHFLYSKDGTSSAQDHTVLRTLIGVAKSEGDMVLCGAMVMLRDQPLYNEFVELSGFKDWVPRLVTCTLDLELHKLSARLKSGEIPLVVVDYIFGAGNAYSPRVVKQFYGVCDHTPLFVEI